MKALMGFEPAHKGKKMYVLLPATLPFELYKMISNSFLNYICLLNMPAYCFDFNVYKQAIVNMVIRSWQHYRRFSGAISFLYHHDNVYPCADPGNFRRVWRLGGGGPSPTE